MSGRKTVLTTAFQGAAKWQVVLLCGVLTVAFMLSFSSADRAAPEGTPGIIELELAFSEDRFSDIVRQWAGAGTLPLQERNLWIDLVFPWACAVLLSCLLAWVAKGLYEEWPRGFVILLALPWVAGLLDWVENVLLLILLRDTSSLLGTDDIRGFGGVAGQMGAAIGLCASRRVPCAQATRQICPAEQRSGMRRVSELAIQPSGMGGDG